MRNAECGIGLARFTHLVSALIVSMLVASAQALSFSTPHSALRTPHSHKFHASITQMDYNDKAQGVEVVTRFFIDDFETAVSQHAKREIKLGSAQALKDKANAAAVLAYLRDRIELKSAKGVPVKFTWVGMEAQADMIWVYYEGKLAGGLANAQFRQRTLHELYEDQVNIVNYKYGGQQSGTMFNVQDGFKVVPEKK